MINQLIAEKTQEYGFIWSALRVTAGTCQQTHYDLNNNGKSLAMLFGEFAGGDLRFGEFSSSDTGRMLVYDGRGSFDSEQSSGQRLLIEAFYHRDTPKWEDEHKKHLATLGFRLALAGAGESGLSGTDARTGESGLSGDSIYHALVSQPHDRVLVEGCCENGSLLQRKTKFSRGCKVVPITKDDDFASDAGMRKCVQNITGPSDTLWFSAPCTGGSTWQFINLKRGPETVAKIKLHWKLFKRLWAAFELVATHALNVGARVFVEWPRRCAYWRNDRVVKFLTAHGFINADFDGCMYGLVATKGRDAGMPIQKPWRVACSPNSCLPTMLNKRCDGSHDHTPCAGQNTLLTQGYTPEIVQIVHQSIVRDIATMNRESKDVQYAGRAILCVGIDEMEESKAVAAMT